MRVKLQGHEFYDLIRDFDNNAFRHQTLFKEAPRGAHV